MKIAVFADLHIEFSDSQPPAAKVGLVVQGGHFRCVVTA